jgi:hypothetical protein
MRAVKRPSVATALPPTTKLPSRWADSDLRHLETVIRHVVRAQGSSMPQYLDEAYWLRRLERIERETCLVPAQQRRITALRELLLESKSRDQDCA